MLCTYMRGSTLKHVRAGAKQHVHRFFGYKGLGIQQGTSVWVGSRKLSTSKSPKEEEVGSKIEGVSSFLVNY